MLKLDSKVLGSAIGACAGLAGLIAGGGGCSGSCPSCFGCAAAGTGVLFAALFSGYKHKEEEGNGLA